jgi:hypothetical protein
MYYKVYDLIPELQHYLGIDNGLEAIIAREPAGSKIINVSPKLIEEANREYCNGCSKFTTKHRINEEVKDVYIKFLTMNPPLLVKMAAKYLDKIDVIKYLRRQDYGGRYGFLLERVNKFNNNSYISYWLNGNLTDEQLINKITNAGCVLLGQLLNELDSFSTYLFNKVGNYYETNDYCYGFSCQDMWSEEQLTQYKNNKTCANKFSTYPSTIKINHPDLLWVFDIDDNDFYVVDEDEQSPLHFPNVHNNGEICFGYVDRPNSPKEMINTFWGSHFNKDLTIKSDYINEYVDEYNLDEDYYRPDDFDPEYDYNYEGVLRAQDWFEIMPNIAFSDQKVHVENNMSCDWEKIDFSYYYAVPENTQKLLIIYGVPEVLSNYRNSSYLFVINETADDYICNFHADLTEEDSAVNVVKINKEKLENHE